MQEKTDREQEIVRLREDEGLTYQAIGVRCGISKGRASQIYHDAERKRREQQRKEFYEAQNQIAITFELTLGETVILQRILNEYMLEARGKIRHTLNNPDMEELEKGIDYLTAESLSRRLCNTEQQSRNQFQDKVR